MIFTRRQTLIGAAAKVAAAALPAVKAVADDYVLTPETARVLADMVSGSAWRRKELMP